MLHAGLGGDAPLGGILGLSTYLPAIGSLEAAGTIRGDVPVMLAHGIDDSIIPIALAEKSAEILKASGVSIDWSTYAMGHEVVAEEIQTINGWLRRFESR